MLMMSPPHWRYIMLSARVENCGPSMQTTVFFSCSGFDEPRVSFTSGVIASISWLSNGSPNIACATTPVSSKKEAGRMLFVRSMIWLGMMKSPGAISSRREPTALNATMAFTPTDERAAILALAGTAEGLIECATPCRARKAMRVPFGRDAMVMGELG